MQSQRQYLSTLGTAFLWRPANSSRILNSSFHSSPSPALNSRRHSPGESSSVLRPTPLPEKYNLAQKATAHSRWLLRKPVNVARVVDWRIPSRRDDSVSGVDASCDHRLDEPGARVISLRPRVVFETEQKLLNRAKRQRAKRQNTRRSSAIRKHLELAEEQLENTGWQIELLEVRIGFWKQLDKAEKQSDLIGKRLQSLEGRIQIWKRFHEVELELCLVDTQLQVVDRRLEAWRKLDTADVQLDSLGKELELAERRVFLIRKSHMTANGAHPVATVVSPLIVLNVAENSAKFGAVGESDEIERKLVTNPLKENSSVLKLRNRIWERRRGNRENLGTKTPLKMITTQKEVTKGHFAMAMSTPSGILARWLSMKDGSEREAYWQNNRVYHRSSSLPLMLIVYLRQSANPKLPLDTIDQARLQASKAVLRRRSFTLKNVAEWAWILTAQDTKVMIERFISTASRKPSFVLLEILRRDIRDVRSFKLLLNYSWNQLKTQSGSEPAGEIEPRSPHSETTPSKASPNPSGNGSLDLKGPSFLKLRHLLYHARHIWPPAIVSISYMVLPSIDLHLGTGSVEPRKLDRVMHWRLSKLLNHTLRILALPASISPMKSMAHNWQAQKVLLEMTTHFQPPLLLDQNGYRAVAQVLAASKKSKKESKAAILRTRSWPPWRVEQDGMDAQRSPEDDLSRVIAIGTQAKESGYNEEIRDRALRILGGQESDGTPTIPTRTLSMRRVIRHRRIIGRLREQSETQVWAARIESTRDVQEAWSAFSRYQETGRIPTPSMYFAMITKLQFEAARTGRKTLHGASPGDGKEVLPPSNDNFSTFYQSSLQPPTVIELYRQMRQAGYRPSGRLLAFLIQRARTPGQARMFMADARVSHTGIAALTGNIPITPDLLKKVHIDVFTAYVMLLCRLAPRSILVASHREPGAEDGAGPAKNEWRIQQPRHSRKRQQSDLDVFMHVARLLKIVQPRLRPAWYAFFGALARRNVVLDRSLVGHPENDIIAWKVLIAALDDFHKAGLELDPRGFQIICNGCEKAILASFKLSAEKKEAILDSICIVMDEFTKLSEAGETAHATIPTLLHSIEGAHLHAYVRVLGLAEDYDGLMHVLRWMVQHHVILEEIADQSRNGSILIIKTIVAFKVFFGKTEYEAEAERLVNTVEKLGGWPQDYEAQQYISHRSGWEDIDKGKPAGNDEHEPANPDVGARGI